MKSFLIVFFALVVVVAAANTKKRTKKNEHGSMKSETAERRIRIVFKDYSMRAPERMIDNCTRESDADEKLVSKLLQGNWKSSNKNLKKFVLCVLVHSGHMSPEGVLRQDAVFSSIASLDKVSLEKIIDACLPKKFKSVYDTAWSYMKCFHLKDKQHSLL